MGVTAQSRTVLPSQQKECKIQKQCELVNSRPPFLQQIPPHKKQYSLVASSASTFSAMKELNNHEECRQLGHIEENICNRELPFRIEGDQLRETLHRSVVALTFLNVHKTIKAASGVLVSRDTVLTAAHNVYQRKLKSENSNFKVYIGVNGVGEVYHQVEAWRYPKDFETSRDRLPFDYAILKLKKTVEFDRFLSISPTCQECLVLDNQKITLRIFGFPHDYPPDHPKAGLPYKGNFKALDQYGKKMKLYQYGLSREGRITGVSQFKIGYGISTLPGQSGSPVVIGNTIIAVHVGGEIGKEFNVGRIADETLVRNIIRWGKQLSAASFNLEEQRICKHKQSITQRQKRSIQIPVVSFKKQFPKYTNAATQLWLNSKGLKGVDLREYTNLLKLQLPWNRLGQIDLSHCPHLTILNLRNNQLRTIDLTNNNKIVYLELWYNQLQEIDVGANPNLAHLYLSSNKIAYIDLTNNTFLETLCLWDNRLTCVRLWIADNVREERYIKYFGFSNQESASCRVYLMCDGQGLAVRKKAVRIADKKLQEYSDNDCTYIIVVL